MPGLLKSDAMARLHALDGTGNLVSGPEAFALIWAHTPGFRWLSRALRWAPFMLVARLAYEAFLIVRPRLQRAACRLT